jgi:ATP-dependent Clp protease ATP-binding subunit ClpC
MLGRVYARFTERGRQVVVLAEGMARNLGHPKVGTEHMLLGLIAERDGLAAWTLDSVGLDLEGLCAMVVRIVGRAEEPTAEQLPFRRQATCAAELANVEVERRRLNFVGTEHVLLGLLDQLDADPDDDVLLFAP